MPSAFKRYTIQDRTILLQKPTEKGKSYKGLEDVNQVDLAQEGEEPKRVWITIDLTPEEETLLISTLKEYRDVFAWSYKDLKGVDPALCQHTIPMKDTTKPSQQRPYTYNDNFAKKTREKLDKLLEANV